MALIFMVKRLYFEVFRGNTSDLELLKLAERQSAFKKEIGLITFS